MCPDTESDPHCGMFTGSIACWTIDWRWFPVPVAQQAASSQQALYASLYASEDKTEVIGALYWFLIRYMYFPS